MPVLIVQRLEIVQVDEEQAPPAWRKRPKRLIQATPIEQAGQRIMAGEFPRQIPLPLTARRGDAQPQERARDGNEKAGHRRQQHHQQRVERQQGMARKRGVRRLKQPSDDDNDPRREAGQNGPGRQARPRAAYDVPTSRHADQNAT